MHEPTSILIPQENRNRKHLGAKMKLVPHRFSSSLRRNRFTKSSSKLWGFLNSPLGLWLLTSVLLGSATWLIDIVKEQRKQAEKNSEIFMKIGIEVDERVSRARLELSNTEKATDEQVGIADCYRTVHATLEGDKKTPFAYPEYVNRSFRSLLVEMARAAPTDRAKGIYSKVSDFDGLRHNTESQIVTQISNSNYVDLMNLRTDSCRDARKILSDLVYLIF